MTTISLIFIFLLYLGGMQLVYWVKLDEAKYKASEQISNHALDCSNTKDFVFTTDQYKGLHWIETDKEFEFQGHRYDIATLQYLNNGIKLTCYNDNEETEIAQAFQKFADKFFPIHKQSNNSDNDVISKITKEYTALNYEFNFSTFENNNSVFIQEDTHSSISLPDNIWHPPTLC